VAAKEWVPPSAAAATIPAAANGTASVNDSQQQQYNNWQYGGWAADGSYDGNGYEYGYSGWQANDATAAQWGQSGKRSKTARAGYTAHESVAGLSGLCLCFSVSMYKTSPPTAETVLQSLQRVSLMQQHHGAHPRQVADDSPSETVN